jgi:ADP-heptose:LPS heptosyltransferase
MRRRRFRIVATGGIGDAILTTPSLRALKERYPDCRIVVYCVSYKQMEVFKNNPYIDRLRQPRFPSSLMWRAVPGLRRSLLQSVEYGIFRPSLHNMGKATDLVAEMLGVRLRGKRPEIFLTEAEVFKARALLSGYPRSVTLHISGSCSVNKNWPLENWERVVESNPELTFIQLGLVDEPLAPGAVDFRGMPLRETFAVIKQSLCFVGIESGMAHAAAAFDTPGVVLFGPTSPLLWGHSGNINVYSGIRCSPCIDILGPDPCPYQVMCMTQISVAEVSRALKTQVSLART